MAVRGGNSLRGMGLDHPTRRHIYQHLLRLPGDHFRSIARSLGLALGTTTHHLEVLVRDGFVGLEKTNGRCRYYAKGSAAPPDRNQLFMKHWSYRDLRLRVLFVVIRNPGARVTGIAKRVGISRQLAAYHLARLEDAFLVRRDGGQVRATADAMQLVSSLAGSNSAAPRSGAPARGGPGDARSRARVTRKSKGTAGHRGTPVGSGLRK